MSCEEGQLLLPLSLPPPLEEPSFCVSPSNQIAWSWVQRWPHWPSRCLLIWGEEGSGKSYLGKIWAQYAGAERLESLPPLEAYPLRGRHFLVDDLQDLVEEELLFYLIRFVQDAEGSLLMLSRVPPPHLPFQLRDLLSRLRASPQARLDPPDDVLLAFLLQKLFTDRQVLVSPDVIEFLQRRVERSFQGVQRVVTRLMHVSLVQRHALTLPFVRKVFYEGEPTGGTEPSAY